MTSLTTQRTCNCTLEVTKRHRRAVDEMGVEMGTCKNLQMREGNMEQCKSLRRTSDEQELYKNTTLWT